MKRAPWMTVIGAEFWMVTHRTSGKAAVGIAFAVGVLASLGLYALAQQFGQSDEASMQAAAFVDMSVAGAAGMALKIRNFFVLPLLLVWVTGTSITGEIRGQTLREDLVRPVSRGLVLSSKMIALGGLSAVTLMASYVPSVLGGIVFFGLGDDGQFGTFGMVSLGYLACWASDMGLIAITVALGLFVRTVGGLVVSLVMILMADLAARLMLDLGSAIFQTPIAGQVADFLPGAALAAWEGWRSGWEGTPFVGLVLWTSLALCTAFWRFSRADVA